MIGKGFQKLGLKLSEEDFASSLWFLQFCVCSLDCGDNPAPVRGQETMGDSSVGDLRCTLGLGGELCFEDSTVDKSSPTSRLHERILLGV